MSQSRKKLPSTVIKVKLFDPTLPFPTHQSKAAAAFDLYTRQTVTIKPHTVSLIPLNIAVEIPSDYWLLIAPRSSTHKLGIMAANGIGIGDPDFCGEDDEYHFAALNFTDSSVTIQMGTRIAQALLVQGTRTDLIQVPNLTNNNRGGFGSTGTH